MAFYEVFILCMPCGRPETYVNLSPMLLTRFDQLSYVDRLGEGCSHIAAVLFKIECAVRLGYMAGTSQDGNPV